MKAAAVRLLPKQKQLRTNIVSGSKFPGRSHLVVSNENLIWPDDLDLKLYESTPAIARGLSFAQLRDVRRDDELKFLESTIQDSGGNKAEAARRLQITTNHLQHLLNGLKASKTDGVAARGYKDMSL